MSCVATSEQHAHEAREDLQLIPRLNQRGPECFPMMQSETVENLAMGGAVFFKILSIYYLWY